MAVRGALSFVLSMLFFFSLNAPDFAWATMTHDQKSDIIAEAYMSLKNVVQTLVEVHTTIQDGAENTTNNIATLENSKSRSEFEVNIMAAEHQQMLAEAARRGTVLTPEEQSEETARGDAIADAQKNVTKLGNEINDTKHELDQVNSQLASTTLSVEDLTKLQDQANAKLQNPDDQITIPTTTEIKTKVDEQLSNVQTVIDTVAQGTPVRNEAQELKNKIKTKFDTLLNPDSGLNMGQLTTTAKEIDTSLLQLRQLDLFGSAAKMEL